MKLLTWVAAFLLIGVIFKEWAFVLLGAMTLAVGYPMLVFSKDISKPKEREKQVEVSEELEDNGGSLHHNIRG